jgi:anti-sigma factor (TIGR02949 family)
LLTCKEFLDELTDYLDANVDVELRQRIEAHINECPNCFVILDTTKRTIQVYKGLQAQPLPEDVQARLMKAVERKCAGKKPGATTL